MNYLALRFSDWTHAVLRVSIPILMVFPSGHLVSGQNDFFLVIAVDNKNLKLENTTISLRSIANRSQWELNKYRLNMFHLNLQHEWNRYLLIFEMVTSKNKDLALYLKMLVTKYLKLMTRLIWSCDRICNKSKSWMHIFSTSTLTWKWIIFSLQYCKICINNFKSLLIFLTFEDCIEYSSAFKAQTETVSVRQSILYVYKTAVFFILHYRLCKKEKKPSIILTARYQI